MTIFPRPEVTPLGASGVLARFGDAIDIDLTHRITEVVRELDVRADAGLVDLVPSYTTLQVTFDPSRTDTETVSALIVDLANEYSDYVPLDDSGARVVEIPVVYGGEEGPDIQEVAQHAGLTPEEVVRRHSAVTYTVGALGFAPGFAFLIGLPPELATPRRSSPRTRVPPGSVGIAGGQTGVYSLPTPGGWSIIGRTPRRMFDPNADPDNELRPGDAIRFIPIDVDGTQPFFDGDTGEPWDGPANPVLEVVSPGVQATVQDLGRAGQGRIGITPGGAMDRGALIAGNRLLGNPDGAAAIEWTLIAPHLRFVAPARIVITGADPGWILNEALVGIGEVLDVASGDELRSLPNGNRVGARGYICLQGGIDVPSVRGSRSLDLSSGFGGGFGRPLKAGDRLGEVEDYSDNPLSDEMDSLLPNADPVDPSNAPFRIVRGPQADRFDEEAWQTLLSESFKVDAQSNRMGLRLNGPPILPNDGADVISEGVATGAIQVTGSGQPIVLLPGRATIGGYTKIATVIEADHDRLGQLAPGATIRFVEVSQAEAVEALQQCQPSVHGGLRRSDKERSIMPNLPESIDGADAWTPDGVVRVVRELANQDVRAFTLRVEAAGLEIAIDRGGELPQRSAAPSPYPAPHSSSVAEDVEKPDSDHRVAISAPLLGIFYRKPSPDEPPFVEEGATVEAGQTIGLIEVMKTFNEVTAEQRGRVARILVEDGATVEFGDPLMELEPEDAG